MICGRSVMWGCFLMRGYSENGFDCYGLTVSRDRFRQGIRVEKRDEGAVQSGAGLSGMDSGNAGGEIGRFGGDDKHV